MKFKVPFTFADPEIIKRRSKFFLKFAKRKKSKLEEYLQNTEEDINNQQYMSICYRSFLFNILILSVIFTSTLGLLRLHLFYFYGLGSALLVSIFIFINQINYPKMFAMKKERNIEKNLIPLLQDMMVQLNSGVPIFKILVNISSSDYGEASGEFKKITKEINSGVSQIEAIEKYGKLNTSEYFRRVLWQISNGMRAGSDISIIIREEIRNLNDEQAIQIESYGNKLNPLTMFYMLLAVIIPALSITFLIIIASILNAPATLIQLLFFVIFGVVLFVQIMFMGLIKSRRPTLL